jgi:Lon protease-like protein
VSTRLPLFPLGTVLFPGVLLPLHVFEERYRSMVRDLLDAPAEERRFGVVAIREGREVGADGIRALHAVGCGIRATGAAMATGSRSSRPRTAFSDASG